MAPPRGCEARIEAFRAPLGWETYAMISAPSGVATPRYIGTYSCVAALERRLDRDVERYGWRVAERSYYGLEASGTLEAWRRVARVKVDGVWGSWAR